MRIAGIPHYALDTYRILRHCLFTAMVPQGIGQMANGLLFIDKRIEEIEAAVALLRRNVDKQEWNALDSNLLYIAAKANTALAKLHEMQRAWVEEIDAA